MAPSPDCMVDVSKPWISEHVVHPLYASRMGAGVVMKQQYSFWEESPAFRSYCGLQLVRVTISSNSPSLTLFLEVHQYRAIDIPKDGQHDFPSGSLCLEFFVGQRWQMLTDANTVSIVSYSLVHNGTPRTHLLSQFDGEKHLLHEYDSQYAPDISSAVHACDHQTTALGPICYKLSYTQGHHGQYCTQSHDSCWILQQFHQ